jgi:hypothetical protein
MSWTAEFWKPITQTDCRIIATLSAPFRQELSARGLAWAVGVPYPSKGLSARGRTHLPQAGRGWPRKRHLPNILSVKAEDMLAQEKWRTLSWRKGTKGSLKARFAAARVRVEGPHGLSVRLAFEVDNARRATDE